MNLQMGASLAAGRRKNARIQMFCPLLVEEILQMKAWWLKLSADSGGGKSICKAKGILLCSLTLGLSPGHAPACRRNLREGLLLRRIP